MKLRYDWFSVPDGEFKLGRKVHSLDAFEISFTSVTLGQYQSFIERAGYSPVPDRIKRRVGYLLDYFTINYGSDPSQAMYGVTHDDAAAYCEWANVRLPTNAELGYFFDFAVRSSMTFVYAGQCWTSDSEGDDRFIARDGPYQPQQLRESERKFRRILHRHEYELEEATCIRVVRT